MEGIILKYFPGLDHETVEKLAGLEPIYREWNSRINVISRKDFDNFVTHHLLHSLSIARFFDFKPGSRILDAGTGGGFPGIPLAILFPGVEFTLADSIGKKIMVVSSVAAETGIKNVRALNTRMEKIGDRFDFIVSRAVTAFPQFISWTGRLVSSRNFNDRENGILYLKGGDLEKELGSYSGRVRIYDLKRVFSEEYFDGKKLVYLARSLF